MLTLESLNKLFPQSDRNEAQTGLIPMEFFQEHEAEIAKICREHKLRRFYRGPRQYRWQTSTLKSQARGVLLYSTR